MLGVRLGFVLFGTFWGAWAVGALDIQEFLAISDGGLGLLVAATVVGTLAANVVAGALAERWGTSRATQVSLAAWGVAVLVLAVVPEPRAWMVVFLVVVALGGMVDVVLNIAGTGACCTTSPGQLLRVHASYNLGTVAGAAVTGAALALLGTWRWAFAAAGLGLGGGRRPRPRRPSDDPGRHRRRARPARSTRSASCAGAGSSASRPRSASARWWRAASGPSGCSTCATSSRWRRSRAPVPTSSASSSPPRPATPSARPAPSAPGCSCVAVGRRGWASSSPASGCRVEVAAGRAGVAALGLAVASMGVATYWPLLSAVAVQLSDRPGLAVGGVTAAGYLGFLAGPPLVGLVADRWGLEAGVLALVVAAAGAAAATGFSPLPTGSSPGAGRAR